MSFDRDTSEQAQEVRLSRKVNVTAHSPHVFKNNPVHETSVQKRFVMLSISDYIFKNILEYAQ